MNKKTISSLFVETLFQIPDYQRGYAWEDKQLKDFIQDIDALVEDEVRNHYTGTIVVYCGRDSDKRSYGIKKGLDVMDVVDGQQRLTTTCLYLAEVLRELIKNGQKDYESGISEFLYSGATTKLTLNNDTADIFYDLLKTGKTNTDARSPHGRRLIEASDKFSSHIQAQMLRKGESGVEYLKSLYEAITQKLNFTFFTIEEESEIGMTFELMNSRGKDLSVLELLKNYLMHWVYRNAAEDVKAGITRLINKNWKDAYTNIGQCNGNEDQCLRIAWILYCSHTPKNWIGYDGFKGEDYIPLRNFTKRSKQDTQDFVEKFSDGLAEISRLYASILKPAQSKNVSANELVWLSKIHRSGNTANFLPLLVAAQKQRESGIVSEEDYIKLLESLERYAYRVFLLEGRRSNAGKSSFYRWAYEVFINKRTIAVVTQEVRVLIRHYAPEESFMAEISHPANWYGSRNRLKYTLFEYELKCLKDEGKEMRPKLGWRDLKDSTLEHILPQNPETLSQWRLDWSNEDIEECLHDIGNIVLTKNNSNYYNFEYERKRGEVGISPSYSDSDIRQERRVARHETWNREEFNARRKELVEWIHTRWATLPAPVVVDFEIDDEADEDGIDSLAIVEA